MPLVCGIMLSSVRQLQYMFTHKAMQYCVNTYYNAKQYNKVFVEEIITIMLMHWNWKYIQYNAT